jgi:hypothetical protein
MACHGFPIAHHLGENGVDEIACLVDFGVGFQRRYGRSSPGIYIAIVGDTVRTTLSQDHRKAFQSPESKCRRPLGSRACELQFRKALH